MLVAIKQPLNFFFFFVIDPEEFLNMMFKVILHVSPFISIRYFRMAKIGVLINFIV